MIKPPYDSEGLRMGIIQCDHNIAAMEATIKADEKKKVDIMEEGLGETSTPESRSKVKKIITECDSNIGVMKEAIETEKETQKKYAQWIIEHEIYQASLDE